MHDLKTRIINILRNFPLVNLATVRPDGKPWVRYVMTSTDDDLVIRSSSYADSRKITQIRENPEVHINCGVLNPATDTSYLQIQAIAEVTNDINEKKSYWTDMLKIHFTSPEDPNYRVIVMRPYRIEYWGMGSMEPEVLEL